MNDAVKCQERWVNGGKPAYQPLALSHHRRCLVGYNGDNFTHIQAILFEELCQLVEEYFPRSETCRRALSCADVVLTIVETECLYDVSMLAIFCLRWSDFSG